MLQRDKQVIVRFTLGEQFQLVRTAQEAGMSVAAFIRDRCLNNDKIVIINRELVRDVYQEMNRIGKNINQIAKITNTLHHISAEQHNAMLGLQAELNRIVNEKLGGIEYD